VRLGIYVGATKPMMGGAHTLIETIRRDIASSSSSHERVIFFEDESSEQELIVGGIKHVNVTVRASRSLAVRAKRKALNLVRKGIEPDRFNMLLKKERIDLLWIAGPFDLDISVPYIFTVWDLGHRMAPFFPEVSNLGWSWEARESMYQKMLYKASYVVTGNNAGKQEILANYPVNADKIKVVPFPIPDSCLESIPLPESRTEIAEPFIFYPAQFWAHKNHVILIKALRYLRDEKDMKVNCYFAGSDTGNQRYVQQRIDECRLGDQVKILGFVDDSTLRYLYTKALAMTFVSLLGPNNLPPLEAAALGCPVILSDLPGHRQQMADAALYVNATNSQALGDAIAALLSDSKLRQELVHKGSALAMRLRQQTYFSQILKVVDEFAPLRDCWE
jgi:glycosyltransferase involved in cell wall biosynthesis